MRIIFSAALLSVLFSCENNKDSNEANKPDTVINLSDSISLKRDKVDPLPVASFKEEKAESDFSVKLYETAQTFNYLLKVKYHGHDITDTLKVPNFGILPKVEVKKADVSNACIIGFLDKEKQFKEYKLVSGKGDKLKITVLKRYAVATYRVD